MSNLDEIKMPTSSEIKRLLRLFVVGYLLGAAVLVLFFYVCHLFLPEKPNPSIIKEINDACIQGLKLFSVITVLASLMAATNWMNERNKTHGLIIGLRLAQIGIGLTLLGKLYLDLPNSIFYRLVLSYCFSLAMPAITALVKSEP